MNHILSFSDTAASLIDKAMEERELEVPKTFFDVMGSKGVREAVASLPKDAERTFDTDGILRVNGKSRVDLEDSHARKCSFETDIGGKTWIVDGTLDYSGNRDWCGEFWRWRYTGRSG